MLRELCDARNVTTLVLLENQILTGRILKLLEEMRWRRKFFWSNVHVRRRSSLRKVTANIEKAVFAVVLCAHV